MDVDRDWAHDTVSPDQFKIQKQTITQWFSEYNEKQRNIIIEELLDMCHIPQLHLISTRFQANLHKQCFHNCQDLIACLPQPVSLNIFRYLDPVGLCKASQVCRLWKQIAGDESLWKSLSLHAKYAVGDEYHGKLIQQYTKLSSKSSRPRVKWKKLFAEQYRISDNWKNGRCRVKTFEGHSQGVSCVQFDDLRLISGSYDSTIKVWDIRTNRPWAAQTLAGHSDTIRCLVLFGNKLVSGSNDCTIKVWDLNTDRNWSSIACKVTMVAHSGAVRCLHVAGEILISGSYDQTLRLWHFSSGDCIQVLRGHNGHVLCVQANASVIVSGSSDETVKMWNFSGDCLQTLAGHNDSVTCLQLDGEKIISGSLDFTIRFWNIRSGQAMRTINWLNANGHTSAVRCIHADGLRIVSGSDDRTIKVWNQLTGDRLMTLRNHTDGVTCIQSSATHIVSGSYDKRILLWDFSI